jgi:hypothetical protein
MRPFEFVRDLTKMIDDAFRKMNYIMIVVDIYMSTINRKMKLAGLQYQKDIFFILSE